MSRVLNFLWALSVRAVALFGFFALMGGFSPGDVLWLTLIVAILAVLFVIHQMRVSHELSEHSDEPVLREVVEGRQDRDAALASYAEFVDSHESKFRWMLRAQRLLPKLPARMQRAVIQACGRKRFIDWAFGHYLRIASPEFAAAPRERPQERQPVPAAA